jgi:uncharacterized protein YifN (PemK superfamily)
MALSFQPKVGNVLMCDFEGYVAPEMIKKRPVVVIARNRANNQLVTVVPLSTTAPEVMETHHYRLPLNPVPAHKGETCWAKCDMLATVSITRMDRMKDGWNRVVPIISAVDLNAIRLCVVNALQLKSTIVNIQAVVTEVIIIDAAPTTDTEVP